MPYPHLVQIRQRSRLIHIRPSLSRRSLKRVDRHGETPNPSDPVYFGLKGLWVLSSAQCLPQIPYPPNQPRDPEMADPMTAETPVIIGENRYIYR